MSAQNAVIKQLKGGSSSKIQDPQFSERRLVSSTFFENVLSPFNHMQDSIDITQFPNPKAQAKFDKVITCLSQNTTFNSPKGELGYTNSVLLNISPDQDIEMFLAGYMRMKIRSLIKVDISSQQTQVNALIEFSVFYGKLPRLIVDYLKQSLILRFSKKNSILLKQTQQSQISIKVIEDDFLQLITFSIDLPLTFHFQPYYPFDSINVDMSIWFSPFQKISNLLTVTIEELVVRYDDLMVQFADIYTQQEFEQVENYFKYLKRFNGNIRKLIIKVNLMNLCQPNLTIPKQKLKLSKYQNHFDQKNNDKKSPKTQQIPLSKLIRQKYHQMSALYTLIQSEGNSPMQKFRFSKPQMENQFRIHEIHHQLSSWLNQFSMSSNKLTYEEEHLLGQYEIVSSELNVRYSCYKYLKLQKKFQIHSKIYSYIQQIRTEGYQKRSQVQPKQRQIVDKIILKQRLNNQFSSNPQIIIPQFPSDILIKQNNSSKNIESKTEIKVETENDDRKNIIKQVAEQMQRGKQGPKSFQFAHFQLSIYKHPFVPLAIVFFPLWIIATINLIIYFSGRDLSNRIANIATLLISYVAYFPIFRQQIPEYRYLLLAEILAYLQIVCSFLTLLHSLIYMEDPQQSLDISSVGVLFWVSFGITTITILAVIIAYIFHKFIIQPKYQLKSDKKSQTTALRHILWNNFQCDFAFLKKQNFALLNECVQFEKFIQSQYTDTKPRNLPKKVEKKHPFDVIKCC